MNRFTPQELSDFQHLHRLTSLLGSMKNTEREITFHFGEIPGKFPFHSMFFLISRLSYTQSISLINLNFHVYLDYL